MIFLLSLQCSEGDKEQKIELSEEPGDQAALVILHPDQADGALEDRYLGYAIDTAQFVRDRTEGFGGEHYSDAFLPDLENQKLINLTSAIAPSLMRIGGTMADGVYFCPEEGDCELPVSYAEAFRSTKFVPSYLTREDIRRMADFAEAVDSTIMFCLNFGPGPRDPKTGAWTDENAEQLIRYARSLPNGDRFSVWEAGNETNVFPFNYKMPPGFGPAQYAEDLKVLRNLLDWIHPDGLTAGPASYFFPLFFVSDIFSFTQKAIALAHDQIDLVTWHLYATQSESCGETFFHQPFPATAENLFDESIIRTSRSYAEYVRQAAGDLPVWLAESASAQCGGEDGVSNAMLDALWYADWIGIMAQEGSSLTVRQVLSGFDYGMIELETYEPYPTFLALSMFRRMVARARIKTDVDRDRIKAHGFCSARIPGNLTLVLVNPKSEAVKVQVQLGNGTLAGGSSWTVQSTEGLAGHRASIEGEYTDSDGFIPDPPGAELTADQGQIQVQVPRFSLIFIDLKPSEGAPACM